MKQIYKVLLFTVLIFFSSAPVQMQAQSGELDNFILMANPGPSNNGGSPAWGMLFNLIAGSQPINITDMTTASTAAANAAFSVEFFTRVGNGLGGPVGSGPGSSSDGWTSLGSVPVTQGATTSGVSLLFATPVIHLNAGDTVGVVMRFTGAGPRYFGSGTPPLGVYTDPRLTIVTGDARSAPFTTTGTFFTSRELVGEIHYETIVPVELTSFTASVLDPGNVVVLNWSTATELNNSGFSVERKNSLTDWSIVGFVRGAGTSTQPLQYSFTDSKVEPGTYSYRIKQIDLDGSFKYYDLPESIDITVSGSYYLTQNYPNPFNPSTVLTYSIPSDGFVSLRVYNDLGEEVGSLVSGFQIAGIYNVNFDAVGLTSGVYFYKISVNGFQQVKKMLLVR